MPVDPVILQLKAEVDQYQANLTKAQRHSDAKLDAIERKGVAMGQKVKAGFSMMTAAATLLLALVAFNAIGLVRIARSARKRKQSAEQPAPFWLLTKRSPLPAYEIKCPYGSRAGRVREQPTNNPARHDRNS